MTSLTLSQSKHQRLQTFSDGQTGESLELERWKKSCEPF